MSGRRRAGGLFGALRGRLRESKRAEGGDAPQEPSTTPEPSTAERLDDALDGLRKRIPDPDQNRSERATSDD